MALFHHFAMHHRNLCRRPAKGQQTDAEPHAQSLGKTWEGLCHGATLLQLG
jgi:hypothetical protein